MLFRKMVKRVPYASKTAFINWQTDLILNELMTSESSGQRLRTLIYWGGKLLLQQLDRSATLYLDHGASVT